MGVDVDIELAKDVPGPLDHDLRVDENSLPGFVTQEDILGYRHRRHQVELLVDNLDAQAARQVRRHLGILLPVDADHPAVRLDCAGNRLDQGGLAGAVFAQQRMHFPGDKVQRNFVERQHAGILLGEILQGQYDRFIHHLLAKCTARSEGGLGAANVPGTVPSQDVPAPSRDGAGSIATARLQAG